MKQEKTVNYCCKFLDLLTKKSHLSILLRVSNSQKWNRTIEGSTEVMYILEDEEEDKLENMQKQLGCMNGIFQLFDRRYLLGLHRNGNHHKKLPKGQSIVNNKVNNATDKLKDQTRKTVMKEKTRPSVESSRNSSSSSSNSSLDCSKRVQTEPTNNKNDLQVDIRDVVKYSMTRKPRAVSVKTVANAEPKGPTMTHVDSPRPLQTERRDQNLVKFKETCIPREAKRFSYDDKTSVHKLKSLANVKDQPKLSLDSKQSFVNRIDNVLDQSQTHEPRSGANKRLPSSLVARLMGLEDLNCEALKVKSCLDEVKQTVKVKVKQQADPACQSVYGPAEKRFSRVEFKASGKGTMTFEKANLTSHSMVISNRERGEKVKKVNSGRGSGRNLTTKKQVPAHTRHCLSVDSCSKSRNSRTVSARLQRSKIVKQSDRRLNGPNSNSNAMDQSWSDTCHTRNLSEESDTVSFLLESDASFGSHDELELSSKDWTLVNKNKFAERLMKCKLMSDQPSPVSVLDAFDTENAPSPVKKKSCAFKDDEYLCFAERNWTTKYINLFTDDEYLCFAERNSTHTGSNDLACRLSNTKPEYTKQFVNQTEPTISPHETIHKYIKEILSASGFLKNLDFATAIFHLHPTRSLINPELFNIMEKTKQSTSKTEKINRKLIFDSVNSILVQKLATHASTLVTQQWRKGRILDSQKLLEELCLEVNNLYTNKAGYECNVIDSMTEDWDRNCNEVTDLVLDIEWLIFEDLITEIMNFAA